MTGLAFLEQAERMLAKVASTDDALNMIDAAEMARAYAKQAKLGTASINHAQKIKLKAECRLATIVEEGQKSGAIESPGGNGNNQHRANVRTPDISATPPPAKLEDLGVDRQRLAEARKIRDNYGEAGVDAAVDRATAEDREVTRVEFIRKTAHVSNNSGENEWYTPPHLIEAARACMGGIDLDPASSAVAQATVLATDFYTAEDDGLAQTWVGGVWLNPPYSQPLIGQFVDKLLAEYTAGHVRSAVVLVNNATDTAWGQKLLAASVCVCFLSGRVRFLDPAGHPSGAPLQGQMVVWLDRDGKRDPFDSEFSRYGAVL